MALFCVWIFRSIFGTVVEDKQMSTKDRLERKKYMGVCRWESEIVARMMSRFPSTVSRYMNRNSPKRIGWNLGSLEKP
jgi:IS30 family transposase